MLSMNSTPKNRLVSATIAAKRRNRVYHHSWDYTNSPPASPKANSNEEKSASNLSKSCEPSTQSSTNALLPVSVISSPKIWRTRSKLTAEPRIPFEFQCPFRLTEVQDSIVFQKPDGQFLPNPIYLCFMQTKSLRGKDPILQIIDIKVNGELVPLKIVFSTLKVARFVHGKELERLEVKQNTIKRQIFLHVAALPEYTNLSPVGSPIGTPRSSHIRKAVSDSNLKESIESESRAPIDVRSPVFDRKEEEKTDKEEMRSSAGSANTAKAFAAVSEASPSVSDTNNDLFEVFTVCLLPTIEETKMLNLKPGKNQICLVNRISGMPVSSRMFLLSQEPKLIVVNVDAAIIKKMDPNKKKGWRSDLLADVIQGCDDNGYQMIYYSNRTIKLSHQTSMLLDLAGFPSGPVLLSIPNLVNEREEIGNMLPHSQLEALSKNLTKDLEVFTEFSRNSSSIWPRWLLHVIPGSSGRKEGHRRRGSKEENESLGFFAGFGEKEDKVLYQSIQIPQNRMFLFGSKNSISINGSKTYSGSEMKKKLFCLFPKITQSSFEEVIPECSH